MKIVPSVAAFSGAPDGLPGANCAEMLVPKACASSVCPKVEERRVRAALEAHLDVVETCADRQGELVGEVESGFAENTQLLVGAQDVIAKDHPVRERARVREVAG